MATHEYNLAEVSAVIMGIPVFEFIDGDAISVEFNEDDWVVKQGHNGMVIRAKKPNAVATLKLKLVQGSPSLELLASSIYSDLLTGAGAAPSSVKDINGTSLFSCPHSWCTKRPALNLSTEPGDVELDFTCAQADIRVGQNNPLV